MLKLYFLLLLMLLSALTLLALPVFKNRIALKSYFIIAFFTFLFASTLYQFSADKTALLHWLTKGQQHYQLLQKFNELGGVNGAIQLIKQKLANDSNDVRGWFILGKLYLANQDYANADVAFSKAHELQPDDEKINYYYEQTKKKLSKA